MNQEHVKMTVEQKAKRISILLESAIWKLREDIEKDDNDIYRELGTTEEELKSLGIHV